MSRNQLNIKKERCNIDITISTSKYFYIKSGRSRLARIVLHCSGTSKPVLVKAKDTYILILMAYAFALTSPPYSWYLQVANGKIVSIKKIIKILETQLVCAYLSFILFLIVTSLATYSEYQKHLFSNDYWKIHLLHIEKLGEAATVSENWTYEILCFIQKCIYRGKTN